MPQPNPKPTIILASGSWYPARSFDPLAQILHSHGYTTKSIAWPSITCAEEIKDLSEDIAALRALVEPEVQAGRDVVVVAHSWAGLPVNSGLGGLLAKRVSSSAEGNEGGNGKEGGKGKSKGGVVKLLFIAAFVPEIGQSLVSTFGGGGGVVCQGCMPVPLSLCSKWSG